MNLITMSVTRMRRSISFTSSGDELNWNSTYTPSLYFCTRYASLRVPHLSAFSTVPFPLVISSLSWPIYASTSSSGASGLTMNNSS